MFNVNNFLERLAYNALKNCIRKIRIFKYQTLCHKMILTLFYKNFNKIQAIEMRKYKKLAKSKKILIKRNSGVYGILERKLLNVELSGTDIIIECK